MDSRKIPELKYLTRTSTDLNCRRNFGLLHDITFPTNIISRVAGGAVRNFEQSPEFQDLSELEFGDLSSSKDKDPIILIHMVDILWIFLFLRGDAAYSLVGII